MGKMLNASCVGIMLLAVSRVCVAADMAVQLGTADGSTKMSIQNSAATEVASVDSLGNATFKKVTQTGSGGSFILNQNTLQSGATFYVSSGTAAAFNTTTLKFADGTQQTTAGTLNGVTAGIGLTGGGSAGHVTLNLASDSTNYIQNTASPQAGATFNVSSGTVGTFNIGALGTIAGKYRIGAIQGFQPSSNFLFQFSSATVNGTLAITFANVGLQSYAAPPFVLVSPVYALAGNANLDCHPTAVTATGMTIQCVLTTQGVLGTVTVAQDATNRQVNYLLMGVAP